MAQLSGRPAVDLHADRCDQEDTDVDEDRTLARLRALRSDLIHPTIAVHNGRVIKRTGDGAPVEFCSVVDAVRCAIEVQNAMVECGRCEGSARLLRHTAGSEAERRCEAGRTAIAIMRCRSRCGSARKTAWGADLRTSR